MKLFSIYTKVTLKHTPICFTARHADVAAREVSVWTAEEGSSWGRPHVARSREFSAIDSRGKYVDEKAIDHIPWVVYNLLYLLSVHLRPCCSLARRA